jgi:hypothetical protein
VQISGASSLLADELFESATRNQRELIAHRWRETAATEQL